MAIIEREKNKYRKNFNVMQSEYELNSCYRGDSPYRTGMFAGYGNSRKREKKKQPNYEVIPGVVMGLYYRNKLK